MAKLKLDLHDIYNKGYEIDKELNRIVEEAIEKKIALVEIIPGKGSGQLKKKVLHISKSCITASRKTIRILGGYLSTSSFSL